MKFKSPQGMFNKIHSLGTKFYAWILLFIFVPFISVSFYTYTIFEQYITREVNQRSNENISKIEGDINSIFDNIVKISTLIGNDDQISKSFTNENEPYYDRFKIFDSVVNNILESSMYTNKVKILLFDRQKNAYSNWSLNFQDYMFIFEQDWVQEAIKLNGHLVWSLFEPSFIKEDEKNVKYISLTRAVKSQYGNENSIGTLIISIQEDEFKKIFLKYSSSEDSCVLISNNEGKIIISADKSGISKNIRFGEIMNQISADPNGNFLTHVDKKKYLINYYSIRAPWTFERSEWKVSVFTNYENMISDLTKFTKQVTLLFIIFGMAFMIATAFITRQVVKPIKRLNRNMLKFSLDKELTGLDTNRKDEIGKLNRSFFEMSGNIKELFEKLKMEHQIKEKYRYESLRAQLNPHFLFNTLNMIRWMALIRKADNIVESIDALGTLLRFSMSKGSEIVHLREEMENIKSYVFIQNNRYGGRYEIKYLISDELLEYKVIKFILQPIVENSLIHAFKNREGRGIITVTGKIEIDKLILLVEDNGIGMSNEQIENIFKVHDDAIKRDDNKVTGLGVNNVNERIKISYGQEYGIMISSAIGLGTTVKYVLPKITE